MSPFLHPVQAAAFRHLRGERIRCLVAYGEYWFPWYMRRLGERPANGTRVEVDCTDPVGVVRSLG